MDSPPGLGPRSASTICVTNALGHEQGVRAIWNRTGALAATSQRVGKLGFRKHQARAGSRLPKRDGGKS
jgi:hypothetical protein